MKWTQATVSLLVLYQKGALCAGQPSNVGKVAVLVDADPALASWFGLDVDDDLAIAFLAGTKHVSLVGATATFGNAPLLTTCKRLAVLLQELGVPQLPRACGSPWSWAEFLNGIWPGRPSAATSNEAAETIAALTRSFHASTAASTERIVWLSLGAMTNVAAALRLLRASPAGSEVLPDEIVVLGARTDGGWELNVWSDSEAAGYVLAEASCFVNVTLVPMDVVAGAVVGMRMLGDLHRECSDSWVAQHIGRLKRYAWIAGHFQRGIVGEAGAPRSVHGFRPWDVAAAAAIAHPGQLFLKSSYRTAMRQGSRIRLGHEDASGSSTCAVQVLSELAAPQFLAVMFDRLCSLSGNASEQQQARSGSRDVEEL